MRFRAITIFCLLCLLLGWGESTADEPAPSEYRIKAAFIYNFAKFVEWPAAAFVDEKSPFVIGVLGENPFGEDLVQTVRDKQVNNRPFEIRALKSPDEAKKCHIVFIATSEKKNLTEIVSTLGKASVLTIGETDHFTESGGMVNFVLVANKIRFQINDESAHNAGLKISSKLMSLALRPAP